MSDKLPKEFRAIDHEELRAFGKALKRLDSTHHLPPDFHEKLMQEVRERWPEASTPPIPEEKKRKNPDIVPLKNYLIKNYLKGRRDNIDWGLKETQPVLDSAASQRSAWRDQLRQKYIDRLDALDINSDFPIISYEVFMEAAQRLLFIKRGILEFIDTPSPTKRDIEILITDIVEAEMLWNELSKINERYNQVSFILKNLQSELEGFLLEQSNRR
jgi:hypothetical protein